VYQVIIGLVVSLAVIWVLRQVYANHTVRIRDGFYQGMHPFVPFVLVLTIIGLQLVPLAIGTMLYSTITNSGIAVTTAEQLLWLAFFGVLALISLYLISSSLFALYIVSLPNMTPMAAVRSARQLVSHRRWIVMRKIICLPIALLIIAAFILIPLILFATAVAPWVFFILSTLLLVIVHSYMYALYRSLL
jgi:hypothetical protein